MSDYEELTPNQKRALSKGLAALEAMADIWAAEIKLSEMAARVAAEPDTAQRTAKIAALIHLGFVEGAYRHYLDHKDKCDAIAQLTRELADMAADRDSWERQNSDRVDDAVQFARERDEARAEVERLTRERDAAVAVKAELINLVDALLNWFDGRDDALGISMNLHDIQSSLSALNDGRTG